jgi:hypothetical protein
VETDADRANVYRQVALAMTAAVTTAAYTTAGTSHPAILRRQSYAIPALPLEGSYSWGDHYLLEAMSRTLKELTVAPVLRLSAPASAEYGSTVTGTVTATLPGGTAPAVGVPVVAQWRPTSASPWAPLATTRTGLRGTGVFSFRPRSSGQLRVVSSSATTTDTTVISAASAAHKVTVTTRARLHVARRYFDRYVLAIPAVAAPSGTRIALQERIDGAWLTVRTITSLPGSSMRKRRFFQDRSFRAVPLLPAGSRVSPAVSPTVKVPRR